MESLRATLKWLETEILDRSRNDGPRPPDDEPEKPVCSICRGIGWLSQTDDVDDPRFGHAIPCSCRNAERLDRAERRSALDPRLRRYTFDALVDRAEPEFAAAVEEAFTYAAGGMDEPWLAIIGTIGWAKTHLALAILNYRIDHPAFGRAGRYVSCPQFLRDLRQGFVDHSDHEIMALYQEIPLLILDDLGAEYHRRGPKFPGSDSVLAMDWADEQMYALLDRRYLYRMETVITSNVDPALLEPRIRDRMLDTGSGLVRLINRDLSSYRTRRPK